MIETEILALKLGLKKSSRKIIDPKQLPEYKKSLKKHKLKYLTAKENYIYFSKDIEYAKEALFYESKIKKKLNFNKNNFNKNVAEYFSLQEEFQTKLGKLFGYPECCIKEYIRFTKKQFIDSHKKTKKQSKPNYVMNSYENTKNKYKLNFLLNNFSKKRLIVHFPCSYECKKSIKLAKRLFSKQGLFTRHRTKKALKKKLLVTSEEKFTELEHKKQINEDKVFNFC